MGSRGIKEIPKDTFDKALERVVWKYCHPLIGNDTSAAVRDVKAELWKWVESEVDHPMTKQKLRNLLENSK